MVAAVKRDWSVTHFNSVSTERPDSCSLEPLPSRGLFGPLILGLQKTRCRMRPKASGGSAEPWACGDGAWGRVHAYLRHHRKTGCYLWEVMRKVTPIIRLVFVALECSPREPSGRACTD